VGYFPNPAIGGVGGMYEYANATVMGIDQANTYHPLWTAGVVAGTLDGWAFAAGVSGTFTAVADLGGGRMRITTGAPHGLTNGRVVFLTSASVAGYRPPNATAFIISNVAASTFDVTGVFTSTASGTWTAGACLTAGTSAAGEYELFWSASAKTGAGVNKTYKFEAFQNAAELNKAAAWAIIDANGPSGFSGSAFVTVAAGDHICLACQNQTDATDVTIVGMNLRVLRYRR
jgi:hypothetical protein